MSCGAAIDLLKFFKDALGGFGRDPYSAINYGDRYPLTIGASANDDASLMREFGCIAQKIIRIWWSFSSSVNSKRPAVRSLRSTTFSLFIVDSTVRRQLSTTASRVTSLG
jgi:hypothetical protein